MKLSTIIVLGAGVFGLGAYVVYKKWLAKPMASAPPPQAGPSAPGAYTTTSPSQQQPGGNLNNALLNLPQMIGFAGGSLSSWKAFGANPTSPGAANALAQAQTLAGLIPPGALGAIGSGFGQLLSPSPNPSPQVQQSAAAFTGGSSSQLSPYANALTTNNQNGTEAQYLGPAPGGGDLYSNGAGGTFVMGGPSSSTNAPGTTVASAPPSPVGSNVGGGVDPVADAINGNSPSAVASDTSQYDYQAEDTWDPASSGSSELDGSDYTDDSGI